MEDMLIAENVSAESTEKNFFVVHCLKQEYILGFVHKENLQDLSQHAADSVKVGKLTSVGNNAVYSETWQPWAGTATFTSEHVCVLNCFAAAKYIGKAQKNTIVALSLDFVASTETEATEKVHDLFVTKNRDMLVTEIFFIPFCVKVRYQEKCIMLGRESLLLVTSGLKSWDALFC